MCLLDMHLVVLRARELKEDEMGLLFHPPTPPHTRNSPASKGVGGRGGGSVYGCVPKARRSIGRACEILLLLCPH